MIINYYYYLMSEKIKNYSYDTFMTEFKLALICFPFFVSVWFNSENSDKLLDKCFPIKFIKNYLLYLNHFILV